MASQCNIDRRGRRLRGVFGFLMILGGIYLVGWTRHDLWGAGAIAAGAFAIYESIVGWCAIRAMGIKTPW